MTRPSTNKRPRLAQGLSSKPSRPAQAELPTVSVSDLSSRSSTASATTGNSTAVSTLDGAASVTSLPGVASTATTSTTRTSPPQPQHHFPVQHSYHSTLDSSRDSRHTALPLFTTSTPTSTNHPSSQGGHTLAAPTHHMPQHSGSGAAPVPSSVTVSSSTPQQHPDSYQHKPQQSQDFKPPLPSGHYMNNQLSSTTLPPLTSPIGPPPGQSASAPPFITHQTPPVDQYQQRNHYSGSGSVIPPVTPTSAGFVDRQQSAPIGPAHQASAGMEHPPQHHAYGPPAHAMDAPVNGLTTSIQGPNGAYQATAGYPAPSPHHHSQAGYYPEVPHQYSHAPAAQWSQPPQQQPQKPLVKKNSRAHVVSCFSCRHGGYLTTWCRPVINVGHESRNVTRHRILLDVRIANKKGSSASIGRLPNQSKLCMSLTVVVPYSDDEQQHHHQLPLIPRRTDRNIATLQEKVEAQSQRLDEMSKNMASMLELLKSQQSAQILNGTPTNQTMISSAQTGMYAADDDDEARNIRESAPGAHSTGAQHLSKKFPMTKGWFKAAGVGTCEIYPYQYESRRGTPRIFGSGWSGDDSTKSNIGHGQYNASYAQNSYEKYNKGGINPNGTLRLDSTTVKRLYDSYMQHMWVIYPIFNAEELKQRILAFILIYSPEDEKPEHSPAPTTYAQSPPATIGMKRSFSEMQHGAAYYDPGQAASPKRPVDYSLNNAIILLVLALGKLCEHDDYIMDGEIPKPSPFPNDCDTQAPSPHFPERPGSTRSTNSSSSPKYPNSIINATQSFGYNNPSAKNVEKFPGLAYYAEAASILGHCIGRRGLDAVHAYIMAGLYWGQMGFVLQAADWIHMGGNAVIEVLHTMPAEDITLSLDPSRSMVESVPSTKRVTQTERDLFLFSFWTLQQMEGDILAELERLAPSGLATHQQINGLDIRLPSDLVGTGLDPYHFQLFESNLELENVAYHFSSQLKLRIYLNRAHLALYSTDQQKEAAINKQRELTWADLKPEHLWETVQAWRQGLPLALRWRDDEEPSRHILQARLRAKYYGFVYIVSRKVMEDFVREPQGKWIDYARLKNATLVDLRNEDMKTIGVACKRCILAATASTTAFDNTCDRTKKRAKLPNIMGTFTA